MYDLFLLTRSTGIWQNCFFGFFFPLFSQKKKLQKKGMKIHIGYLTFPPSFFLFSAKYIPYIMVRKNYSHHNAKIYILVFLYFFEKNRKGEEEEEADAKNNENSNYIRMSGDDECSWRFGF